MNDNYEKVIKNSNWSKNAENFGTNIINKGYNIIDQAIKNSKKEKNGNKALQKF